MVAKISRVEGSNDREATIVSATDASARTDAPVSVWGEVLGFGPGSRVARLSRV